MECTEYRDLVAAHADGHLVGSELASADRHSAACGDCGRARAASVAVRRLLRDRIGARVAPPRLRANLEAIGKTVPGKATRWVVQGAIAAAAVFALASLARVPATPLRMVVADVHALSQGMPSLRGDGPLDAEGASAIALESRGWRLVGARRGTWGPMSGTMSVYRAADGKTLALHEMRAGPGFTMPPGGVRVGDRTQYFVDGVVLSLVLRGGVVTCLAARMPSDEFARRVIG